jgi:hypothetical protein
MPPAQDTTLVTLRLELGTETISGTVATERAPERPFWGWLELSEALDATRGVERSVRSTGVPADTERLHEAP